MKYPLMMKNRMRRTVRSFQKQRKGGVVGAPRRHPHPRPSTIAILRRRIGNPVFPVAAFLDCFAALTITKDLPKSLKNKIYDRKLTDLNACIF
jgi:hypothetical protein